MKKTYVVNLYGGPGLGKSTFAAYIFSKLKLKNINCELVTEFAKDLVWEERFETLKDEVYLFGKQQHRFFRLNGKVDVIITDAPLLLKLMYMDDAPVSLAGLVLDTYHSYENIDILLERKKEYNPKGRIQTLDEAIQKDREIESLLYQNHVQYHCVEGTEDGIDDIIKVILDKLEG